LRLFDVLGNRELKLTGEGQVVAVSKDGIVPERVLREFVSKEDRILQQDGTELHEKAEETLSGEIAFVRIEVAIVATGTTRRQRRLFRVEPGQRLVDPRPDQSDDGLRRFHHGARDEVVAVPCRLEAGDAPYELSRDMGEVAAAERVMVPAASALDLGFDDAIELGMPSALTATRIRFPKGGDFSRVEDVVRP